MVCSLTAELGWTIVRGIGALILSSGDSSSCATPFLGSWTVGDSISTEAGTSARTGDSSFLADSVATGGSLSISALFADGETGSVSIEDWASFSILARVSPSCGMTDGSTMGSTMPSLGRDDANVAPTFSLPNDLSSSMDLLPSL